MQVRTPCTAFVTAQVYPFASPEDDARFLASSPAFVVTPEGDILYQAKKTSVQQVAVEAAQMIAAAVKAEQIAGESVDRTALLDLIAQLEGLAQ